jgi:addiction module HigA family antidote
MDMLSSFTKKKMAKKKLNNVHPGEILQEEFLIPLEISAYRLSQNTSIPQTRISEIIKGRRRITADTALRLSMFFGNSAMFWLGLQNDYDVEMEQKKQGKELQKILHYSKSVSTHRIEKKYPTVARTIRKSSLVAESKS